MSQKFNSFSEAVSYLQHHGWTQSAVDVMLYLRNGSKARIKTACGAYAISYSKQRNK